MITDYIIIILLLLLFTACRPEVNDEAFTHGVYHHKGSKELKEPIWRQSIGKLNTYSWDSPFLVNEDYVIISKSERITIYNKSDGTIKKILHEKRDLSNFNFRPSPLIWENLLILAIDNQLIAYDIKSDFKLVWQGEYSKQINVAMIAIYKNYLYLSNEGGLVCRLSPLNGSIIWKYTPELYKDSGFGEYMGVCRFTISMEKLIIKYKEKLIAINTSDGTKMWAFNLNKGSITLPVSENNYLYIQDGNNLHSIDILTGVEKWRKEINYTHGEFYHHPTVFKNMLYILTLTGNDDHWTLVAYNALNGVEEWNHSFGNTFGPPISPTVSNNNLLYVGDYEKIYCLESSSGRMISRNNEYSLRSEIVIHDNIISFINYDGDNQYSLVLIK